MGIDNCDAGRTCETCRFLRVPSYLRETGAGRCEHDANRGTMREDRLPHWTCPSWSEKGRTR